MNEIKCRIEGCTEVFKTEEAVSRNAGFICKNHSREEQVRAAGRSYSESDEADKQVHFQTHQFDRNLDRGRRKQPGVAAYKPAINSKEIFSENVQENQLINLIDAQEESRQPELVAICACGHRWYEDDENFTGPCPECGSEENIN